MRSNKPQVEPCGWHSLAALIAYQPMKKGSFRDNIEKIVRLLPRPVMNGKLIAKSRNFWLIVEEYGEQDGIVVLNKITDHGGHIPYDSIRKWQDPDMVILSAQVNVGKDGLFELSQFVDGPETEMLTEEEVFLPERLKFAKTQLENLTENEIKVLKQLLIQVKLHRMRSRHFIVRLAFDLAPLTRSTLYVRVGPKGGLHATSSSHRRTDSRQIA